MYEGNISDIIELCNNHDENLNLFYLGINDVDAFKNSPLQIAILNKSIETIVILLEYGAHPHFRSSPKGIFEKIKNLKD